MIVERNNGSTTEGKRKITSFALICGIIHLLKWIVAKVEHWNYLLKKRNVNVETMSHKKYDKRPLKTFTSTTRFGYVPNGRKKRFQDYRCRNISNCWIMGIF
jgi:hypothetical protein